MFNVGGPEVLVILLVALIVLGPQQLPKAVRSVGNVMAELRRMSSGFQEEIRSALDVTGSSSGSGSTASQQAPRLAQRPEDADITETVARNAEPDQVPEDEPEHDWVRFDDLGDMDPVTDEPPSANGFTALSDVPAAAASPDHDEWVPSDRASG